MVTKLYSTKDVAEMLRARFSKLFAEKIDVDCQKLLTELKENVELIEIDNDYYVSFENLNKYFGFIDQ